MSFSRTYVLGDSLSDTGTFALTTFGLTFVPILTIPSPLLGYDGRFSDGPVAVEVMSSLFGAPIAEDRAGLAAEERGGVPIADLAALALQITRPESSFAYGSARAAGSRTLGEIAAEAGLGGLLEIALGSNPALLLFVQGFDINLGAQVERLTATLAVEPPPEGALATIFIGLNDLQDIRQTGGGLAPAEGLALIDRILEQTEAAARAAAAGGIDTVALFTFPSVGFFPPGAGSEPDPAELALADALVDVHALGLRFVAVELLLDGIDARIVDLGAMAAQVEADPGGFGFESLDVVSVLGTGSGGSFNPEAAAFAPDALGFYDYIHFSGALHGVFGAFAARTLTGRTRFLSDRDDLRAFGADDDLVFGGGGGDVIFGGDGRDALFGGLGRDALFGGAGADLVAGGAGTDLLYGGAGGDVMAGGAGNDVVRASLDDDLVLVREGADLADGGRGDDVVAIDLSGDVAGARLFGASGVDALVVVNAQVAPGEDLEAALAAAGVSVSGFESVVDDFGAALAEGDARWAMLEEAELWGLFDAPEAEAALLG